MKIKEFRKIEADKLKEKLTDLRNRARELRFSLANNQLKNIREIRQVKKDIAKILTILKDKK